MKTAILMYVLMAVGLSGCFLSLPSQISCNDTGGRIASGIFTLGLSEIKMNCPPSVSALSRRAERLIPDGDPTEQYEIGVQLHLRGAVKASWRVICFSAHQKFGFAQRFLASSYELSGNSQGEADFVKAYKWYSLATYNGSAYSRKKQNQLAARMTPAEIAEAEHLATEWQPNPAECDVPLEEAMVERLKSFMELRERETDLRARAVQGDAEAQYTLAYKLNDLPRAWKWYCLAANQGHPMARYAMGNYYRYGHLPAQKDLLRAYLWYSLAKKKESRKKRLVQITLRLQQAGLVVHGPISNKQLITYL